MRRIRCNMQRKAVSESVLINFTVVLLPSEILTRFIFHVMKSLLPNYISRLFEQGFEV